MWGSGDSRKDNRSDGTETQDGAQRFQKSDHDEKRIREVKQRDLLSKSSLIDSMPRPRFMSKSG